MNVKDDSSNACTGLLTELPILSEDKCSLPGLFQISGDKRFPNSFGDSKSAFSFELFVPKLSKRGVSSILRRKDLSEPMFPPKGLDRRGSRVRENSETEPSCGTIRDAPEALANAGGGRRPILELETEPLPVDTFARQRSIFSWSLDAQGKITAIEKKMARPCNSIFCLRETGRGDTNSAFNLVQLGLDFLLARLNLF